MADRRRPPVIVFFIVLFIGLFGLYRVTQSPRFDSYRTLDVNQLVASGACIGASLMGFMVWLLRSRS
jgi:hypothetical protein